VRRALAVVLLGVGWSAGCGGRSARTTLAAPGSENDDGAGQLASASAQLIVGGVDNDGGFASDRRTRRDDGDGASYGGGAYGGGLYGGGAYGGYLYGGYTPYGAAVTAPQVPSSAYSGIGIADGGALTGTVRWPRPPSAPAVLSLRGCGEIANPSLLIGHGAGVAEAIVYLARIDRGRAFPVAGRAVQVGGQVERRGCALEPTVQVATPVPSSLSVVNADAGKVTVGVGVSGKEARLALDEGMSRTTPLGAGPARIADDAGALVPAWVVGVAHPYYAMTDGEGRFRIDDVPPGSYELVVWHAPVVIGVKDGRVVATAATEVRRSVVVRAMAPTVVDVDLPPAR
jgi:hypothetical protein